MTSRLEEALGLGVTGTRRMGGQHGVEHHQLELADGRLAFAKIVPVGGDREQAGFVAEAEGLRWLESAAAVPVPAVLAADESQLVIQWVAEESAAPAAARHFGAELARLHAASADHFGAPWPAVIAGLPLPSAEGDDWPVWYASQRVLPYLRLARDAGGLSAADASVIESVADRIGDLAGPAEPPSRIHGDCWSGNVLWSQGRGWLIDPAAHGGHRETDLAMLSLFGAPHLDLIRRSYQEVWPLADGWRDRIPLHQLHPLLVHVCLFGSAYREAAVAAARAALRA
jgi:fructosamine-3-kinase